MTTFQFISLSLAMMAAYLFWFERLKEPTIKGLVPSCLLYALSQLTLVSLHAGSISEVLLGFALAIKGSDFYALIALLLWWVTVGCAVRFASRAHSHVDIKTNVQMGGEVGDKLHELVDSFSLRIVKDSLFNLIVSITIFSFVLGTANLVH